MSIGIFGASGAVGKELLKLFEKASVDKVRLFGSLSVGEKVPYRGSLLKVEKSEEAADLAFAILCTESGVSKELAPVLQKAGTIVIDHSSFFRLKEKVPLVIPEINPEALFDHEGIIASPNCTTTLMLLPLAPLKKRFGIKRIIASTYQAASGAGQSTMEELKEESFAFLQGKSFERKVSPHPYAFNLFTHPSALNNEGYAEEEMKMVEETRKILGDPKIQVSATCVRVPVLRAHSESLNVELCAPCSREEAVALVGGAAGVTLLEDWKNNRFPMPVDATGEEKVFCGRIRLDRTQPNTIELWVVGDQLLKGAALNSFQILQLLKNHG